MPKQQKKLTHESLVVKTDRMLQRFDYFLRKALLPVINQGEVNDTIIADEIDRFFHEEDYKAFQWDDLGIYGGGFGLSHHSRKHFILFQTRELLDDVKGSGLPYLSDNDNLEQYQDLIDYLFLGRRLKQPLVGDKEKAYSPEFYWQLAHIYYPDLYGRELFAPSPFDRYLAKEKLAPYVYCPIGEVAFFLYAWRLLFRYRQRLEHILSSPFKQEKKLSLREDDGVTRWDIWNKQFWEPSAAAHPEWDWIIALQELDNSDSNMHLSEDTARFTRKVNSQWNRWQQKLDSDPAQFFVPGQPWVSDWFNLGLLNVQHAHDPLNARPTDTLTSLIRFALRVASERSTQSGLETYLIQVSDAARAGSAISWSTLEDLDSILQDAVRQFLTKRQNGNASLLSLFSELHTLARFPIMPFFYWTAVDQLPKEHFVFPIWESWRFPVSVKLPNGLQGEPPILTLPAVGIALFAIRPMSEFGLSAFDAPGADHEKVYAEAYQRLFRMERFFVRIGRPMIDSAFYGILVRDTLYREGRAEQVDNWAHALQTKLALLQMLYDKLSADSRGALEVKVKKELWQNMGGSLLSLRRTINALSYYKRVKEFLKANKKTLPTLRDGENVTFRASNRGIGHILLDAFHLMAAKVSLGDSKYGDLEERLPSFRLACLKAILPPLMTNNDEDYPITFKELADFLPADGSVRFIQHLPEGTSLSNFEAWKQVELNPGGDPIKFRYDAMVGVVLDEMLSNACKHVNKVGKVGQEEANITIELIVEKGQNTLSERGRWWANIRVVNTAAFEAMRGEDRSLLNTKSPNGLGLFFNRELCDTLTGSSENYEVTVAADYRHVVSNFRFPVNYSPILTEIV
jgi:hypothetical protein